LQGVESGDPSEHVIRASEIGQYVYCPRAWWLNRVVGIASENTQALSAGAVVHQRHGRMVWLSRAFVVASVVVALIALAALILSLM
jgi:CRISPR/Cas system-associated exonuclease Cas4 (RecB family)